MSKSDSIPKTVRIGHLTYSVKVDQAAIDAQGVKDGMRLSGASRASTQTILLADDLPFEYQREVFMHEVLHQCLRVTGIDPDADGKANLEDIEERAVNAIAGPLSALLRDSPEVVAYLTATDGVIA